VENAHKHMDTRIILAHISEKAVPVFGAETGRRSSNNDVLRLTNNDAIKKRATKVASIEKRMRAVRAGSRGRDKKR
jgi:hypothetical protein